MKKILITAHSLNVGGIETSLLNLLEYLKNENYKITLCLEKKEGIFINKIPKDVIVKNINVSSCKNKLFRKAKNFFKILYWKVKVKNKYDCSISYATYSKMGAIVALAASNNSMLWIHGNYYKALNEDKNELEKFFKNINFWKFKKHIFVSYENYNVLKEIYNGKIKKAFVINNIIDGFEIIKRSKENLKLPKYNCPTFLNVSRHEEKQKKLSRIIKAAHELVKEGFEFKIIFVGDGEDNCLYRKMSKSFGLEDICLFVGKKTNPYPYFKKCDAVLLSSNYEGFPVVYNEAKTLRIPIITNKVSDYNEIENIYGIVEDDIYNGMKKYLLEGFELKKTFDYKKYNQKIINALKEAINDEN